MIHFLWEMRKYLNKCISSGYVSNFVNLFEKKIASYTKSKFAVAFLSSELQHCI